MRGAVSPDAPRIIHYTLSIIHYRITEFLPREKEIIAPRSTSPAIMR